MVKRFFAIAAIALFFISIGVNSQEPPKEKVFNVGQNELCIDGYIHHLTYNVSSTTKPVYDYKNLHEHKNMRCDMDGTRIKIYFHNERHALEYYTKFKIGGAFLTGISNETCPMKMDPSKGFLLRNVNGCDLESSAITVHTSQAKYDEVYEDASIQYRSSNTTCGFRREQELQAQLQGHGLDKTACVGLNTNKDLNCSSAAQDINIYSNSIVSITCEGCYVGLQAEWLFDIEIHHFQLQLLKAGFQNGVLNAGLGIKAVAQKSWNVGMVQTLHLVEEQPVVQFSIGPVPFCLWFEVPVDVNIVAELDTFATASAGVNAVYTIGTNMVTYDPVNHWVHTKPNPKFSQTQHASGSANFQGSFHAELSPSFTMHVNELFSYTLKYDPQYNFDVHGDTTSKQICEKSGYQIDLTSTTELKININFLDIHDDKVWGPKTIWTTNGTLSQQCWKVNGTDHDNHHHSDHHTNIIKPESTGRVMKIRDKFRVRNTCSTTSCPTGESCCQYADSAFMCCHAGKYCVPNVGCTCFEEGCDEKYQHLWRHDYGPIQKLLSKAN